MAGVYDHPRYYEIAFSFRDIKAEVDTFEQCFQRFAQRPVERVLELGCGPCPHLTELLGRGYRYTGLDVSTPMLAFSAQKAAATGGEATFVQADMNAFSLSQRVDFAFISLGSLSAQSTADLHAHFHAVAAALHPGGLYLLDWCIQFTPFSTATERWTMTQGALEITTRFSEKLVDAVEQLVEETIILEVFDGRQMTLLEESGLRRVIFPQEFRQLMAQSAEWEFIGWWNQWQLDQPLENVQDPGKINRPITLLRRL